jgi:hypothetical protein
LVKTKAQTKAGWHDMAVVSNINIPKFIYLIKEYQSNIDKSRDNHRHHLANLALPSARITLFPIIRARNGTLIIIG